MGSLAGPKARREPAGEAKPDVCVISDGEAGAYCTVGLVLIYKAFKSLKNGYKSYLELIVYPVCPFKKECIPFGSEFMDFQNFGQNPGQAANFQWLKPRIFQF